MKYLYFLALAAAIPTAAPAQAPPEPSGLSVITKRWRVVSNAPPNSVLLEDPFDAIDRTDLATRDQRTVVRQNKQRAQKGLAPQTTPDSIEPHQTPDRSLKTTSAFTYSIRVRNDGAKTVKLVAWDYVFLDPATNLEVGRHSFVSSIDLKPNKTESVSEKRVAPPTRTVNAAAPGRLLKGSYIEKIVIRSVRFADGSMWYPAPQ